MGPRGYIGATSVFDEDPPLMAGLPRFATPMAATRDYGLAQSCQLSPLTRENSDTFAVTRVKPCRRA
jgi:hypothetical protein